MPRFTALWAALALFTTGLGFPGTPHARAERGSSSLGRHGSSLALIETRFEGDDEVEDEPLPAHEAKRVRPHDREAHGEREAPIEPKLVPGETLSGIAKHYGVSVQQVVELNPSLDADRIREGTT